MINWPVAQSRLGVVADGQAGPVTYAALLTKVAGRSVALAHDLALGFVLNATPYGMDANADRMACFLGQTALETGGFLFMVEQGGPAYCARYDGNAGLGNTQPGDGYRFRGRGMIMLTGRANYLAFGRAVGIDLIANPDDAARPDIAVLIAMEFWRERGLNALADQRDVAGITRRINGGSTALAQRMAFTNTARSLLA